MIYHCTLLFSSRMLYLCFVFCFSQGKQKILQFARTIAGIEKKCGMDTSPEEFCEQFKFGLVQVVYEWARGMPFNEITDLTDVQEGRWYIIPCMENKHDVN